MAHTAEPFLPRPTRGRSIPLLVTLTCALTACSGGASATDAGHPADDAPSIDAPRVEPDAPVSADAPASPDSPADAMAAARDSARDDAPGDVDGGIDCALIGCGAPTICGEACDAPCGCCPCGDGMTMSASGIEYLCTGGCWMARGTGGAGDRCGSSAECGAGLSCCYPCGIPGCDNVCEPSCSPSEPECFGGCRLRA